MATNVSQARTPVEARRRFAIVVMNLGGARAAAKRIGCSRSYVDMIRAGLRRPGLRVARAIEIVTDGRIAMRDWLVADECAKVQP